MKIAFSSIMRPHYVLKVHAICNMILNKQSGKKKNNIMDKVVEWYDE